MWDFSKLNLKIASDFVGIKLEENTYSFYLPKGFDDFIEQYQNLDDLENINDKFDNVRDFFFLMYRTLRKFDVDNKNNPRVIRKETKDKNTKDHPTIGTGGISLEYEDGQDCILYSKLSMIERVLEAYDDLAIHSIQNKIRRTDEIDYSKIYKYLDRGIYLDNGAIYIDLMDLPRTTLRYESTDIVNLYCFILDQIIQRLDEDVPENVSNRSQDIQFLAQRFRDDYLTIEHSLFSSDTFEETIAICKDALENIDKNTNYKDTDYWGLYEAIETFLYGGLNPDLDDGDFWGVQGEQGFDFIWEDMCQTYFFKKNFDPHKNDFNNICFADTDIRIEGYENDKIKNKNYQRPEIHKNRVGWWISNKNDELDGVEDQYFYQETSPAIKHPINGKSLYWREVFCIEWDLKTRIFPQLTYYRNPQEKSKWLRRYPKPDLVLWENINNVQHLIIIDFKNISLKKYKDYMYKDLAETDEGYRTALEKQLGYELAIQQLFPNIPIINIFFIPFYFKQINHSDINCSDIGVGEIEENFNIRGIGIFKGNFEYIQNVYLGIIEP